MRHLLGGFLDLLLPRVCVACERLLAARDRGLVCGRCWAMLQPIGAPQCPRCGQQKLRDPCRWCALLPPYVRAVRSVCWFPGSTATGIVHALKYHGWHGVGDGMAERMARLAWPADVVEERRALIPVPLSSSRQRERGFNQSERLAAGLGVRWSVPVWLDVLDRVRVTRVQARLTPGERLTNVSGAFRAGDAAAARLAGAHVVLVDDVVTTASTLNACAAALVHGGARIVSYVTFGRARLDGAHKS